MKFLFGEEAFLVDQELKAILKSSDRDVILYSSNESIENILIDASTSSMFSMKKKMLVIKNHTLFSDESHIDEFIDVIKEVDSADFIFVLTDEKPNKKNKLVQFLLKNADTKEFKSISSKDMHSTIRTLVEDKGGTIESKALIALSTKLPTDLRVVFNEIEKLLLENQHITLEMVDVSINKYLKNDYFALSNAITSNDHHGIIQAYQNQRNNGDDSNLIISQISSILSLCLIVDAYIKQGYSSQDISLKMDIHIFRVKKAIELLRSSSNLDIKELVQSLAALDKDIKTGKIDSNHGLEVYLLKLIQ